MLKNVTLERPLAVLDLETTGTNPKVDRIVEISVLKIFPDGQVDHRTHRLNPGIPIPADATGVHGITDADVANEPGFKEYAPSLLSLLDGCDICGFNIKRFDLKVLQNELFRVGLALTLNDRAIVDAMEIFHDHEPRDLAAAVQFYCDRNHDQGHKAGADVLATADVLDAMLARYADLPRSISGLHLQFQDPNAADFFGRFVKEQGQIRFAFGKHRRQALDDIAKTDRHYLEWMLGEHFPEDTKSLVREALDRSRPPLPEPPLGRMKPRRHTLWRALRKLFRLEEG